ncbi:putative Radial spoke head protein 3-like protein [Hypsibius exemplaris]|uniref:Radial spoke head protein 3-like protein n=1 Tax=Hypsibius exemplaris TaxID=2072580 RepID=A0A1W0WR95_HYPEX|nr:putative Radial spoke head protein 3-like protein [Hypsibius exemplaris]
MAGDYILQRRIPRFDQRAAPYACESEPNLDTRSKEREKSLYYGNMMTDPRIWRGNTYSMYREQKLEAEKLLEKRQEKRLMKARPLEGNEYHRKMRKTRNNAVHENSPAVAGRIHNAVQTELFLQEMAVRTAVATEANQTDEFFERPPSPVFVQAKTGVDADTQIWEGELYLFDVEVLPLLECLNGKVVEQALLEVIQEEELAAIRAQHRAFQTIKNFERAEQQRLEDEQRRKREEKETRKKERRELMKKEQEMGEKVAAQAFAKAYLLSLVPNVFMRLREDGLFLSPARAELDIHLVPWLRSKVSAALDVATAINMVTLDLVRECLRENNDQQEEFLQNVREAQDFAVNTSEVANMVVRTPTMPDLMPGEISINIPMMGGEEPPAVDENDQK